LLSVPAQDTGDQSAILEDERMHFDDPLSCCVVNAAKIAAHALTMPSCETRRSGFHRKRRQRQDFVRRFLSEGLIDHALVRGVQARIGYPVQSMAQSHLVDGRLGTSNQSVPP